MINMFDFAVYTGMAVFCLIVAWTLLVRRRWLPVALVRFVRRPMDLLGRLPLLGAVVRFTRHHSLATALPVAIGVGMAAPWVLFGINLLITGVVMLVMFLAATRLLPYLPDDESNEFEHGIMGYTVRGSLGKKYVTDDIYDPYHPDYDIFLDD